MMDNKDQLKESQPLRVEDDLLQIGHGSPKLKEDATLSDKAWNLVQGLRTNPQYKGLETESET